MNRVFSVIILLLGGLCTEALGQTAETGAEAADTIPALAGDSLRQKAPVRPRTPRTATPVDIDDQKQTPVLHYYDKHGEPLDEPVLFLATLDTVTKPKSKPIYPEFSGVSVGVNFADALMMAFGQKYGSFDVWADVSLWNWLVPVVEAGIGFADSKPDNHNFTYKVKPSFYCKVGVNYNFLYKSDPAYQVFLGLRACMSSFGWKATNITIANSYWQDSSQFSLTGLRSTAWWGELLAGIKVKIVGDFSLGWNVRWHFPFSVSKAKTGKLPAGLSSDAYNKPWFMPGYGSNSSFTFAVSAIWTFGRPAKIEGKEKDK